MDEDHIARIYPEELPYTKEEELEFRRLLRDKPKLHKAFGDFKMSSYQKIRSRVGRSPWLDDSLDRLFEIAAISGL